MIKYTLICAAGHEFESWFSSSSGFDEQARRGFVACPECGGTRVERAIMAPSIARGGRAERQPEPETPASKSDDQPEAAKSHAQPSAEPAPVALLGEREQALRQALVALHEQVKARAEPVGDRFAREALKIHHGESEDRPIYGEATADEARMLIEEGVPVMPLPRLPETGH